MASPAFRRALLTAACVLAVTPPLEAQAPSPPRRIIVTLRPDAPTSGGGAALRSDVVADLRADGLDVRAQAPRLRMVVGEASPEAVARLRTHAEVAAIEYDEAVALGQGRNDHLVALREQSTPWGILRVQADQVWARGQRGAGARVGILDSGGDPTHPDLTWAGGYNAVLRTADGWMDDVAACNGHGTHVAGTIAARDNDIGVVGVAPAASLYAIKVFELISGNCSAWTSTQIVALDWAVSQRLDVVNISIGSSTGSLSYGTAIQRAVDAGVIVVASAGNSGGAVLYPAAFPGAMAVASIGTSNTRSSFSSQGPTVAIAAPGEGVLSSMPGGTYGTKSGTSMAAPHMTGVIALLRAAYPGRSAAELRAAVEQGAFDLGTPGRDEQTGYGLVQAASSLDRLGSGLPTIGLAVTPTVLTREVPLTGTVRDTLRIVLTGTGAASTPWTLQSSAPWLVPAQLSGTGSANIPLTFFGDRLVLGTSNATLRVEAPGTGPISSLTIPVTAVGVMAPTPRFAVAGGRHTVLRETLSAPDSVRLEVIGLGATEWTARTSGRATTLLTTAGTGSSMVHWTRGRLGLAAGRQIDTLRVTLGALATTYIDTVDIVAIPRTARLERSGTRVDGLANESLPPGSVGLTIAGDNANGLEWVLAIDAGPTAVSLLTPNGKGPTTLSWTRPPRAAGVEIRRLTVRFAALDVPPLEFLDTVMVAAAPPTTGFAVTPGATRRIVRQYRDTMLTAQFTVTTGATALPWTVTTTRPATTLTPTSGVGTGAFSYRLSLRDVAPGTHLIPLRIATSTDTIALVDTVLVLPPPPPRLTPGGRVVRVEEGTASVPGETRVSLEDVDSLNVRWTLYPGSDAVRDLPAAGQGPQTIRWAIRTSTLAPGSYVYTFTLVTDAGTSVTYRDTVQVNRVTSTIKLNRRGGRMQRYVGDGLAVTDSVVLESTGLPRAWAASVQDAPWLTLAADTGTGSAVLRWTRDTRGLPAGLHIGRVIVNSGLATPATVSFADTVLVLGPPPGAGNRPVRVSAGTATAFTESYQLDDVWQGSPGWERTQMRATPVATHLPPWIRELTPDPARPFGFLATYDPSRIPASGVARDSIVFGLPATPAEVWRVVVPERALRLSVLPTGPDLRRALNGEGLSAGDRAQLDALGNQNGRVDVGDLLAFLLHARVLADGPTGGLRLHAVVQGPLPVPVPRPTPP